MTEKQFKEFCKNEFEKRGFAEQNDVYYLAGRELLCGIDLQKSNYVDAYYINYFYFTGDFKRTASYPTRYESIIQGRISVDSGETINGDKYYNTQIKYEKYTEEELRPYFDAVLKEEILPPVYQGKKYILYSLGNPYSSILHKDEVIKRL